MLKENVRRTARILCLFMAVLLLMGMFPISAAATSETQTTAETVEVVTADIEESKGQDWSWIWKTTLVIVAIVCTAILVNYYNYKNAQKLHSAYKTSLNALQRENRALRNLRQTTSNELRTSQSRVLVLEDWRNRAIQNYPEIERIIQVSYAKDCAEIFQKNHHLVAILEPTYTNYVSFENALIDYRLLNDDAKMMIGIDIGVIQQKRDTALTHYISVANTTLAEVEASPVGTPHEELLKLSRVLDWYNELPEVVKAKVSGNVLSNLNMRKATADYNIQLMTGSTDDEMQDGENGGPINKFLDSIPGFCSKVYKRAATWVNQKFQESKEALSAPFEDSIVDEEEYEEDGDDDCQDTPSKPTGGNG